MRVFYKAILDVYAEIHDEMNARGQGFCHEYAIQAMKDQANSYFEEAKWYRRNNMPSMEEHMPITLSSSEYYLLSTISFVCMGEIVREYAFGWLFDEPKMVKASVIIARLTDDIVSLEFKQKRGHTASAEECYMNEREISQGEAEEELKGWVFDAWKDMNEGCLLPTEVPMPFLARILNQTRVMDVIYKDKDNYTNAGTMLWNYVKSMLLSH